MIEGEYVAIARIGPEYVCLRCGSGVPVVGMRLHTWRHRLLGGEKDLGPRPPVG